MICRRQNSCWTGNNNKTYCKLKKKKVFGSCIQNPLWHLNWHDSTECKRVRGHFQAILTPDSFFCWVFREFMHIANKIWARRWQTKWAQYTEDAAILMSKLQRMWILTSVWVFDEREACIRDETLEVWSNRVIKKWLFVSPCAIA